MPAHKYRRLHLNLPGLPEGSAFQPEPIMDCVERGIKVHPPTPGLEPCAFVDMSGGSSADAVLALGHRDKDGRHILDAILNQGARPPFDPNAAVTRFVTTLNEYGCTKVIGDRYAGETFRQQFQSAGITYSVCTKTASQLYESFEPLLNAKKVVLLDVPILEQQLLGLVWRGGRIDHQVGEFDDWSNAACGVLVTLQTHRSDADNARDAAALKAVAAMRRPSPWGDLPPAAPTFRPESGSSYVPTRDRDTDDYRDADLVTYSPYGDVRRGA